MSAPNKRCAIYTRKSSDEGLDQQFNSLDAQREAGEAFVKSQASEGWRAVARRYDDGGYSGGTMERPGLQHLLADIEAGRIDVVIVYKIDRLTRSLADFARIVERFDARGVSFVSVTQAFNTTSSMGRLTLNVLLSFAQFEREVTGERIRDKIAASKAKGMWMGGVLPLGYDAPVDGSRTLRINESEADRVRHIFARYLALGSVHRLCKELSLTGMFSKQRTGCSGAISGGVPFSRGALFHLLGNPLYLGKITHKGAVHDGAHPAIIDDGLFAAVQKQLAAQRRRPLRGEEKRTGKALLAGLVFDAAGERMSPTFSRGRGGRIYRYYVSASLQQGKAARRDGVIQRVSALALEGLVGHWVQEALGEAELGAVARVDVGSERIAITLAKCPASSVPGAELMPRSDGSGILTVPNALPVRGRPGAITAGTPAALPDRNLVAALRRAHRLTSKGRDGYPTIQSAPASWYERRVLRLAFLAPDLQRDIIAGRQPRHVNLEYLVHAEIPLAWDEQRRVLAWNPRSGDLPVMAK